MILYSSSREPPLGLNAPQKCELAARLCRVFLQDGIERLHEKIRVAFGKYQRRPQLDDIVMRSVGTGENAAIAKAIHPLGGLQTGGLPRFPLQHEIDPQEQS